MSPSELRVFVLATRGVATNEAGGSSTMKGNTEAVVKQTVCTPRYTQSVCSYSGFAKWLIRGQTPQPRLPKFRKRNVYFGFFFKFKSVY